MPITLYHGPAGSQKSKAIIKLLASQSLDSILFVGPQSSVVNHNLHLWLDLHSEEGHLLNQNFLTIDQFLLKWLKLNEPRVHFVSPLFVRIAFKMILSRLKEHDYSLFLNQPATLFELTQTMNRLYRSGLNAYRASLFFKHVPDLFPLIEIMKRYEPLMESHFAVDSSLLTTSLIEKLDSENMVWFKNITTIVFDRFFPMGPGLREIILRLSKKLPELNILIAYSMDYENTENIHLYYGYTALGEIATKQEYFHLTKKPSPLRAKKFHYPSDELTDIVHHIRQLLASGVPPQEITVILPPNSHYHLRLHELLSLYKIPHGGIQLQANQRLDSDPDNLVPLWTNSDNQHLEDKLRKLKTLELFEDDWSFLTSYLLKEIPLNLQNSWKNQELDKLSAQIQNNDLGIQIKSLQQVATQETTHLFAVGFSQENILSVVNPRAIRIDKLTQPEMVEIFGSTKYSIELLQKQWQDIVNRNNGSIEVSYSHFSWQNSEQTPPHLLLQEPHVIYESPFIENQTQIEQTTRLFPPQTKDSFSISEIETFYKCPFQYYARYHLKLDQWEEDTPDIRGNVSGLLIHRVLDKLYGENSELFSEACTYDLYLKRFKALIPPLVDKIIVNDINIKKSPNIIIEDYSQRAIDTITKLVDLEIEQIIKKVKTTKPYAFEWSFGKGKVPPLTLTQNSHSLHITGRIDRIDVDHNGNYFSVIDYKTGQLSKGTSIKEGSSPQLPLYMMVVKKHLLPTFSPTSGILMGLKEVGKNSGLVIADTPEAKLLWRTYKVSEEEWDNIQQRVITKIFEASKLINEGAFSPKPSSADECKRCGYSQLCHYKAIDNEGNE